MDDFEFYLAEGFSVIPTKGKLSLLKRWKHFQYRQPTMDEVKLWRELYPGCNIAIITGRISKIVGVDVDDMSRLSDLEKEVPEIGTTTSVRTSHDGMHFWFECDVPLRYQSNFLGLEGVELLAGNHLMTAPYSIVDGIKYRFETSLAHLRPFPKRLLDTKEARIALPISEYKGKEYDCIRQILEHDIKEGERNRTLWFLFHRLQIKDKNSKEHAKKIVRQKNKSLSHPLPESEVEGIFRSNKKYHPGCAFVRNNLSFIRCEDCIKLGKELNMKKSLFQRYHSRLPDLNNTERGIFSLFETHFEREIPKPSEIRKVSGTDLDTAKNALRGIDKKIPELGIREKLPDLFKD